MTVFRLAQQNGLMITDHLIKWKKKHSEMYENPVTTNVLCTQQIWMCRQQTVISGIQCVINQCYQLVWYLLHQPPTAFGTESKFQTAPMNNNAV